MVNFTSEKEQQVGNLRLRKNEIAVILLRSPAYEGKIIIPESTQDTRMLSQVMFVLGKGPGYNKKRVSTKNFAEGTKRWRDVIQDLPQRDVNIHYVGHVKVGHWHFMKHPFVRDMGIWVSGLLNTHPDAHGMFDDVDVKMEGGTLKHRVFLTCSSEVLLRVELEEGETVSNLYRIKRGDMLSTS